MRNSISHKAETHGQSPNEMDDSSKIGRLDLWQRMMLLILASATNTSPCCRKIGSCEIGFVCSNRNNRIKIFSSVWLHADMHTCEPQIISRVRRAEYWKMHAEVCMAETSDEAEVQLAATKVPQSSLPNHCWFIRRMSMYSKDLVTSAL